MLDIHDLEMSIKKVRLSPGDTLVVSVQQVLRKEQRDCIRDYLCGRLGIEIKVLVLEGGATFGVLSPNEPDHIERIEQKLDALIAALANAGSTGTEVFRTMDGEYLGSSRDSLQSS